MFLLLMNISVRQLAIVLLCDDALWPMIRIIKLNILGISIFPPRLQCPFRKRYNEKSNFLHKIYLILGNVGKMKLVVCFKTQHSVSAFPPTLVIGKRNIMVF